MSFLGEIAIKLDDKGRMRVPTALKESMAESAAHRFVVNRGFENCLTLYPYDVWELVRADVDKLNTFNKENREFVRRFYSGATVCSLDGSDRINIPKQLLEFADMKKDILLTPVKNYFELWDEKKYNSIMDSNDGSSFEDLAERVMGHKSDIQNTDDE
ncbi:MAG: division/cell wall cluster transcriptional repressor MraZ [Chitinophagales bacterium]